MGRNGAPFAPLASDNSTIVPGCAAPAKEAKRPSGRPTQPDWIPSKPSTRARARSSSKRSTT